MGTKSWPAKARSASGGGGGEDPRTNGANTETSEGIGCFTKC